jgi:hypothetical protein
MIRTTIIAIWTLAMAAAIGLPVVVWPGSAGAAQVQSTIRIALLFYFAAVALMLRVHTENWRAGGAPTRIARLLWSLGGLAYVVHVLFAFDRFHHWSHADAFAHTRAVSGVGEGIFVSYFFTLLWCSDALAWWIGPRAYVRRSAWIGWSIHGFIAFIVFNGAVVYASGPVRWVSAAVFAILAVLFAIRYGKLRRTVLGSARRVSA